MSDTAGLGPAELDDHLLRRSFAVARRALTHGNQSVRRILVDEKGSVLLEAENGYMPSHDGTAHAGAAAGDASLHHARR